MNWLSIRNADTIFLQQRFAAQGYGVQDMPSLYFALLNKASAVEECDASKASFNYLCMAHRFCVD